ncbi:hypothetical protein OA848_00540 [Rickettsiales bacterium]|nr:hypothetical protein [Rickettsiales bacterium]
MREFYGRRCSKTLKKKDLDLLYGEFFFSETISLENKIKFFCNDFSKLNLEIGFGNGENLIEQALNFPREGFIGCDPFMNGHLNIAKQIKNLCIKNIFVTNTTFALLLKYIKSVHFSKVFILFPDPWPKKRHNKRRLINKDFTVNIMKILSNNGKVVILTDHLDYHENILISFESNNSFELLISQNKKNFFFDNIFETKYYKKAISKNAEIHRSVYKLVERNS